MADPVNVLILADRRVTTENFSKYRHTKLSISKVSCQSDSPGQCKASYLSKNGENHINLRSAATPSLLPRSGTIWFHLYWSYKEFLQLKQCFQAKWRESRWNIEHSDHLAKNSVQIFLYWRTTNVCFKEWFYTEKKKQKIFFQGEM